MKVLFFLYNIITEAEKQIAKDTVWDFVKVFMLGLTLAYVVCAIVLIFG